MARIKLGPMVTAIAGSIGGVTIQRNKYGLTMRLKPLPIRSVTPAQITIRTHIVTIQAAWQNLSAAQRLQWSRFLDYSGQTINNNKSVKLSGHALYLKYQMFRLMAGFPLMTSITYVIIPEVPILSAILDTGMFFNVTFYDTVDVSDYFFNIMVSSPRESSRKFSPSGLRFCSTPYPPGDSVVYDIKASYLAAFGVLPAALSYLHYSIQWWSVLSPFIGTRVTGIIQSS